VGCASKERKLVGTWTSTVGGCGNVKMILKSNHTGIVITPFETIPIKWRVEGEYLIILPQTDRYPKGRNRFTLHQNTLIIHDVEGSDWIFYRQ